MSITRDFLRGIARKYALRSGEEPVFDELWKLYEQAEEVAEDQSAEIEAEINAAFTTFRSVAQGTPSTKEGHRHTKTLRASGQKYVVFSDMHLTPAAHRQNWFVQSGNFSLYLKVLQEYFDCGFTLIENGDIEELVIFEPTLGEARLRSDMIDNARFWQDLNARRETIRLTQLQRVLSDHQTYYDQVARTFHAAGRYHRTAGNHDQDVQKPIFLKTLQTAYSGIQEPYDYLMLDDKAYRPGVARSPLFVIGHGHQFDRSTNPRFAPRIGETISECLAWAFQGPDRFWRWSDKVGEWAAGVQPFYNNLVSDNFDPKACKGLFDLLDYNKPEWWECLFQHKIAWEYFENANPADAILKEVTTGDEFIKARHLDEVTIAAKLESLFPDAAQRPKLVLGHSHEVRYHPARARAFVSQDPGSFTYYFNCGTAARFENLVWGLEIVDGAPTLVSWGMSSGPRVGALQRHVYTNIDANVAGNWLKASSGQTRLC